MKTILRITEEYRAAAPFAGKRLLVATHATPATMGFLHALVTLGGRVDFLPVSFSGHGEVLAALAHAHGITVLRSDPEIRAAIALADIIMEDGARISRRIDAFGSAIALRTGCIAIEQTTNGIRYLERQPAGSLRYPVIDVAQSILKLRLENGIATPESILTTLLAVTRRALLDRRILIIGYGAVGSGLANLCRAHGSMVTVVEREPTRQLLSQSAGFPTHAPQELHQLLHAHDIIISCTTNRTSSMIGLPEVALMRDGTVCCNAGSGTGEFAEEILHPGERHDHHAAATITNSGETIVVHLEKSGATKEVHILAGGHPINLRLGSGTSTEAIDIVYALMLLAAIRADGRTLPRAILPLDSSVSDAVAQYYNQPDVRTHVPQHIRAADLVADERPYGSVIKFGLPGELLERFSLARAVFRPNSSTEGHYHLVSEEAYMVEQGVAEMTLWHRERPGERTVVVLRAGDYCTIPREYVHHVRVTSAEDFVCLVIASPPFSFWDQFFPNTIASSAVRDATAQSIAVTAARP
ncbi:cupin domain-containing protein [Candidatus Uhrbacteria bacterium]|nr:cupin domain-containing protein [Candidatus Uhrbacteria bacterium]